MHSLASLRKHLRDRFPESHAIPAPAPPPSLTGIPCVDRAGAEAGTLCEIVASGPSSGLGLLLHGLIESREETLRQPVALIDGSDSLEPQGLSHEARDRLLWLRCHEVEQALRVADLLLRDGNLPRVLLDVSSCGKGRLQRIPASSWHRLRLLAESSGAACLVFVSFPLVPGVHWRLTLEATLPPAALEESRESLLSSLPGRVERRRRMPEARQLAG